MTPTPSGPGQPVQDDAVNDDLLEKWLAGQQKNLFEDTRGALDVEAGLREVLLAHDYAAVRSDTTGRLDVEAGLIAITGPLPEPPLPASLVSAPPGAATGPCSPDQPTHSADARPSLDVSIAIDHLHPALRPFAALPALERLRYGTQGRLHRITADALEAHRTTGLAILLSRALFTVVARDLDVDLVLARAFALARARDLALDRARDRALARDLALARARELARARDLARDLDLALDLDRACELARAVHPDLAFALDLDLARDLARDLDRGLAFARGLDLARDLAFALARGLTLALARGLGVARDLDRDLDLGLARGLTRALDLARDIDRDLDRDIDRDIDLARERDVGRVLDIAGALDAACEALPAALAGRLTPGVDADVASAVLGADLAEAARAMQQIEALIYDMRGADLRSAEAAGLRVEDLAQVRWSTATRWPDDWMTWLVDNSDRTRLGVWVVRPGAASADDPATLLS